MGDGKAREGSKGAREDRLKAALKANLQRRKAQARARADESEKPDKTGQREQE